MKYLRSHRFPPIVAAVLLTAFGSIRAAAQGIEPFHAQDVRSHKGSTVTPGQTAAPKPAPSPAPATTTLVTVRPSGTQKTVAPATPDPAGNLVEPLSNGLRLASTGREIKAAFGPGVASWDSRTITYPAFRVAVGGAEEKIWHLHLTGAP